MCFVSHTFCEFAGPYFPAGDELDVPGTVISTLDYIKPFPTILWVRYEYLSLHMRKLKGMYIHTHYTDSGTKWPSTEYRLASCCLCVPLRTESGIMGLSGGWPCYVSCTSVLVFEAFASQQFVKLYAVFFLINVIFYNFKGWKSRSKKGRKMEERGRKQNDKKGAGKGRDWQRKHCITVSYYHLKTIPNAFGCTFECRNKILIKLSVINTHV